MDKEEKFLWAVQTMLLSHSEAQTKTQNVFLALAASESIPSDKTAFEAATDFQQAYLSGSENPQIEYWLVLAANKR